MKKKMKTLLALATVATGTAIAGVATFMVQSASADNTQSLVFTGVTMDGGLDWTATANANNPTNTNWGNALGLAFSTNIYDIGAVYQEDIQDKVTTISDGNGGYLTNKQLVTYTEADGTTDRYIDVIWYDTQGNLVFRTNDYPWDTSYSTYTEERTGLPYYAYGDGDMVTVKAGFTFTYNDGTQDKDLVLANDVTVQYDLETNSWNEVVKQGATAQIKFASADNVTVSTYNGADGKSWGYLIDLFKGSRPAGFTSVTTDYTVCGLKESAKTELDSWGAKMFSLNANYVKYYNADGTEDPLAAIYYTTSGVVIRTSSESTSIASPLDGEKIYIKKGFRDAYYYGKIHEWASVLYAQEHQGGLQSLATMEEDAFFVYKADTGVWEKANVAPSDLDFADNIKSLSKIYKGQSINIFQYAQAGVTEVPKVSTTDSEVVSISDTGFITGGEKAGSATITLQFTQKTLTLTVENITTAPVVSGLTAKVDADYGAVVLYDTDENNATDVLSQVTVSLMYDNGFEGKTATVADVTVDFSGYDKAKIYNNNEANVQSVSIKVGNASAIVPVHTYAITRVTAPPIDRLSDWGGNLNIVFSGLAADTTKGVGWLNASQLEMLGQYDKITLKSAHYNGNKEYTLNQVTYIYTQQTALAFQNKAYSQLEIGDVLTMKAGYRIYYINNGAAIAIAELTEDCSAVWTGSEWVRYSAEATGIELESTEITLPVGSYYTINYSIVPAGAYVKAIITSSDPQTVAVSADGTAIEVLKASNDPITITVQLGDDTNTIKTLIVNAREFAVVGYQIYEQRDYVVGYGQNFELLTYYGKETTPRKLQAVEVYENGSTGVPFELDETNTIIGALDTTRPGSYSVTLTIDKDGDGEAYEAFSTKVTVIVRKNVVQVSSGLMQEPFSQDYAVLYIDFSQTFEGKVNVPVEIAKLYEIDKYVKFYRGTTEYPVDVQINGEFLVVKPIFDDSVSASDRMFKTGDKIVIAEGLPMILWTGRDNVYQTEGYGDYVVIGTIEYKVEYQCTNAITKNWDTIIEYEGIQLESESIEIGIGKLKDLGATMIPAYATVGEFTITSSNESIVSVNANNLVKGMGIGTATLTITLDGGVNGPITKTVVVNVVDTRNGMSFNKETIYVKKGTALTGNVLIEKGLKAKFTWASGKTEGDVDFSKATVVGYSANKDGEQMVTIRVIGDGSSITEKIKVIVNEKGSAPGCGSTISLVGGGMVAALGGVLMLRKKKED